LEAAAWGMPVFFGTNYGKFKEARDLIAHGGGFSVKNFVSLQNYLQAFRKNQEYLTRCSNACKNYVENNLGAVQKICSMISV
jgi:3-deoxy-D-manno-octulosonic-acid transferase